MPQALLAALLLLALKSLDPEISAEQAILKRRFHNV